MHPLLLYLKRGIGECALLEVRAVISIYFLLTEIKGTTLSQIVTVSQSKLMILLAITALLRTESAFY